MGQKNQNILISELIQWLFVMEKQAATFYGEAAAVFSADRTLSQWLAEMAQEESEHLDLLEKAAPCLERETLSDACFWLEPTLRLSIEERLTGAQRRLQNRQISIQELIELIALAEFSEWNDIFLYAMGILKKCGPEYAEATVKLDRHRREMERFILSFPWGEEILNRVGRMPPLSRRRILVVEDDAAVAKLLLALLTPEAEVEVAADGAEGLERLRERHFDVVVSDVEMPNLDGIEMYRRAVALDAELKGHFVFFTATRKPQYQRFFQTENVIMLPKPSSLSRLRQIINQVAEKSRSTHIH